MIEFEVVLQWKQFQVDLKKVLFFLKLHCSANFDGLVSDQEALHVVFKEEVQQADIDVVNNYWSTVTEDSFAPTLQEVVGLKINDAIIFGNGLVVDATIENVLMGITQAQKTRAVSDYCRALQRYLQQGSLYAALEEINELIAGPPPSDLAPYITIERLQTLKSKLQAYLAP